MQESVVASATGALVGGTVCAAAGALVGRTDGAADGAVVGDAVGASGEAGVAQPTMNNMHSTAATTRERGVVMRKTFADASACMT